MHTIVFDRQPENQKADFDFPKRMELDNVNSNPKESSWTMDHQRMFWMFRHQRTRFIRTPLFDQEINNHNQRSTRPPFKVFVPTNQDRFDTWGG